MSALGLLMVRTPQALPPLFGIGVSRRGIRRGFGVIDGSIFMVLAVAFLVGVMAMASSAMTKSGANEAAQEVTNLSLAIRTIKSSNGYTGDLAAQLISVGQLPSSITNTGSDSAPSLVDTWGGAITLTPINSGAGFTIEYDAVPGPECKLILTGVKSGVLRSVQDSSGTGKNLTDVDSTYAGTFCASDSDNTIVWSSMLATS